VANDTNAVTDIFRYDIETNSIDIISTDNDGIGGNNISLRAVISADGRYVAFESAASNLVAGDINGTRDIFIKDTFTRNTTRVNADVACDVSVGCRISINDDGRYVVFNSNVLTLVTGDTNAAYDVFVADMVTGNIARASIDVFGNEGNNTSIGPDISDDGSAIVFYSIANNLITGDTNGFADVFRTENPLYVPDTDGDKLWDDIELLLGTNPNLVDSDNDGLSDYNEVHRDFDASDYLPGVDTDPANSDTDGDLLIDGQEVGLGLNPHIADPGLPTVLRISLSGSGGEVSRHYLFSSISHDGRYVAFDSAASNLVDGDTNITEDVFLKDIEFGVLTRVSTDASGNEGGYNLRSINPSITADGLQVAFTSGAILTAGGSDSGDVYIKQVQTGNISIVSANASGVASNDTSYAQDISNDGQYLVFQSRANNLVPEDTSAPFQFDIFIKDVVSGAITRLSADENGNDANGNSESARISPDGRYVVFDSFASNLVTGDVNGTADIFMSDTQTGNTTLVSTNSAGSQAATGSSHLPDISINGRYVVFVSTATDLVSGDPDTFFDVFLKDNKTGITSQLSTGDPASEDNDNDASVSPRISDDGRYAVFASLASDVVPGDTNSAMDIFVSETQTGNVARVSTDALGNEGNFGSTNPVISGDGRYITFVSGSSNLVANDTNEDVDFFRVENPLYTPDSDTDGDSVMDSIDNCPLIHNPAQTDTDSNWTGDACQLSITGVWPASATVGEGLSVFIFGENFTTDNTTEVYFNGIRQFLVAPVSTDMLIVRIPSVTSSLFGPVTVTTPSDSTTSTQIFGSPVSGLNLTGVWPGAPKIGEFTSIFLFGTEFTTDNSTEVYFNGIRQFLVAPVSNEMLIVRVLGNASLSGTVTVVTPTGVVNSVDPLIFVP
jgi:hypothetical protein